MRSTVSARVPIVLAAAALAAALASPGCAPSAGAEPDLEPIPVDPAFWKHWGDGRAEVATYDLTFPRYGATRAGTAIAIFVTEPFSESARVKADPGRHPDDDVFQVVKLNLVRDFATGVYDYNTMLSAFVGLQESGDRPAGAPAKVSFSSQEWCGHVYHQVLFDAAAVREAGHSYFDGEGDIDGALLRPPGAVSEDALLLWARGLAAPALAPGDTRTVPILRSLEQVRLRHLPLAWSEATLTRAAEPVRVQVPAGEFEAERFAAAIADGRTWTIDVERAAPHRVLRWQISDGERAEMIAAERIPYWTLNGPDGIGELERLGLTPRPPRTP